MRHDSTSAKNSVTIDVTGGDQSFSTGLGPCNGIYVGATGNIVGRLSGDAADSTWTGLAAGVIHPLSFAVIRQTGTTITASRAVWT